MHGIRRWYYHGNNPIPGRGNWELDYKQLAQWFTIFPSYKNYKTIPNIILKSNTTINYSYLRNWKHNINYYVLILKYAALIDSKLYYLILFPNWIK